MCVDPTFIPLWVKLDPLITTSPFRVIFPVRLIALALPVIALSVITAVLPPTAMVTVPLGKVMV